MIISLKKYLDAWSPALAGARPPAAPPAGALELADRVLWAVGEYVFHDDRYQQFRDEVQEHRLAVKKAASLDRIRQAAEGVESLLEAYRRNENRMQMTQAGEMQKIVAMLNDTLVVLSTGSDRAISRLKQVEKALQRAQAINDLVALKETVAQTMLFVREEMHKEREVTAKVLADTGEEFRRVRKALVVANGGLPGRKDALRILGPALAGEHRNRCFVAVFVIERYAALCGRFGPELAGDVIHGFLRERLGRLAAPGALFLWAPGCVVVLMERDGALAEVRAEVAEVADAAYEYRIYWAERIVPVGLASRWMLFQGADWEAEPLAGEIDAFAGVREESHAGAQPA